jgi:hypothetical protein
MDYITHIFSILLSAITGVEISPEAIILGGISIITIS